MDQHCRLCRRSEGTFMESLFDYRQGKQISEIVMKVCPIQIDVTDLLPKLICEECLEVALAAYELQTKSSASDKYFRNLFLNFNVKKEEIEVKMEIHESEDETFLVEYEDHDSGSFSETVFNVGPPNKTYNRTKLFACNFCDTDPRSKVAIMRHMRLVHDPVKRPHACRYCSSRFETENELFNHERSSHYSNEASNLIFCEVCGVTGTYEDGMKRHKLFDHGIKPSTQQKIVKPPVQRRTVQTTRKIEIQGNRLLCDICGAVEHDIDDMRRHVFSEHFLVFEKARRAKNRLMRQGQMIELVNCEHCDETFRDQKELRNHSLVAHENLFRELLPHEIQQNLICCFCEILFLSEDDLLTHVEEHSVNFQPKKCQHSTVPFKSYAALLKHIRFHAKPKTHECRKCQRVFPYGSKLLDHLRSHNRSYTKFHCSQCNSKFRNQKDLDTHVKVKHEKITMFMCPICAKSLASPGCVSTHIKTVHRKDDQKKDHECKVCLRRFAHKSHLSKHEATHKTERPHVCELCGASFKTRDGLIIHMKRHNGSLMRMQCNQCDFRCPSQHRLNVHLLTHSGAKPHQCQFCDRAYASKGDLTKHLTKVHVGNAIYKCEKCPEAFRRVVELREHLVVHAGDV